MLLLCLLITATPLQAQTVIGTITQLNSEPWTLAVYEAGNKLFVGDHYSRNLLVYDCLTFDLLATIPIQGGAAGAAMVVHEQSGKLYLCTYPGGYHVAVVDAVNNQVIKYLAVDGYVPKIDQALGKIYIVSRLAPFKLFCIDVATDQINSVSLSNDGLTSGMDVNPITHEVFVGYLQGDSLDIIDGNTMTRTSVAGSKGRDLLVNWLENKVYRVSATWNGYWIYDRDTGDATVASCVCDGTSLFFNPTANQVYTSAEVDGYSVIIDGVSNECMKLPMIPASIAIGTRHATNHVYFVNPNIIGIMDGSTQLLTEIAIDSDVPSGGLAAAIAIHQSAGRIFAVNNADKLHAITVVQDTEMLSRPSLFIGDKGTFHMFVLDIASKQISESRYPAYIDQTFTPDPGHGRLYNLFQTVKIYGGCGKNASMGAFSSGGQNPIAAFIHPNGNELYVSNSSSNNVGIIDLPTQAVINTITVGKKPWGLALTPDGNKGFVANQDANSVSIFNTSTHSVTNTIPVGAKPWGIAITPGGSKAYICNSGSNTVSVIDVNKELVLTTVNVGTSPHWPIVSLDGHRIFISNSGNRTVSVIDTESEVVIQTVPMNGSPEGLCALPDGSEIYVGTDSTVSVIQASDYTVTTMSLPPPWPPYSHKIYPLAILDPSSRFAGRVENPYGVVIADAIVQIFQQGELKGEAQTNSIGEYVIFNLLPGSYDVEVTADNYSNQQYNSQIATGGKTTLLDVTLIPFSPAVPALASPPDNAVDQPVMLTVSWQPVQLAETYHLQVATDLQFSAKVVDDSTLTATSADIGPLNCQTIHYWRVRAKNASGLGAWSDNWKFTTILQLPAAVNLISPANAAVVTTDSMQFVWQQGAPAVSRHWFELALTAQMTNAIIDTNLLAEDTTTVVHQLVNQQQYWWRVKAKNKAGWGAFSEIRHFRIDIPSSVPTNEYIAAEFALAQNYPNPFNSSTDVEYSVRERCQVELKIYDVRGQEVAILVKGVLQPGFYRAQFNAQLLASGIYFYKIQMKDFQTMRKMVLIR